MCNVTTLAMQIESLAGSPEKAKDAAIKLLKKIGDSTDENVLRKRQLEDLIMRRFELMGEAGWKSLDGKKPFWKGWYAWVKAMLDKPWHQQALPLNYVALEFKDIVGAATHYHAGKRIAGKKVTRATLLSPRFFKNTLRPALKEGATVMLSTKLTGGHIVLLADVLEQGIIINDPYGILLTRRGYYITNGSSTKRGLKRVRKHYELVKKRLRYSEQLWRLIQNPESLGKRLPHKMGERNFYTWDEVKKYQIGKWGNILYGKSEKVQAAKP